MTKTIKMLICGGRKYSDKATLFKTLDDLCLSRGWTLDPEEDGNWLPNVIVISGMARGADTLAVDWAAVNWLSWEAFPAQWKKHGKAAGFIRNQEMLDSGKPDIVVAFPGGNGTKDMVNRAKKAGVEVIEVD